MLFIRSKKIIIYAFFALIILILTSINKNIVLGASPESLKITTPQHIGGTSEYDNELDADVYPQLAYDSVSERYLVVWLTPRNAQSSSDGFDVYGIFLNKFGQSISGEFRISDDNDVAKSSLPSVISANGSFVVAWTSKETSCEIHIQKVNGTDNLKDQVLLSDENHQHSPDLSFDADSEQFVLSFVDGDDYLPPTLFDVETSDCGNNIDSESVIKAVKFSFSDLVPLINSTITVSDENVGGFRPKIAYSTEMERYLIVWEDRRNAGSDSYRFDTYTQMINSQFGLIAENKPLSTDVTYENFATSATWTPRPAVASSYDQFFVTWFERHTEGTSVTWSVKGNFIRENGEINDSPLTLAKMIYPTDHTENPPVGFLSNAFFPQFQEFLAVWSTYTESPWGYFSNVKIQRLTNNGDLLDLNGNTLSQVGVGYSIDLSLEDQIAPSIAINSHDTQENVTDLFVVYTKHQIKEPAQDFDIWGVREGEDYVRNYLPLIFKR